MNMKRSVEYYTTINNKKYSYILRDSNKDATYVECKAANISQEFLNEDIPGLLKDLPGLILSEKNHQKQQNEMIRFRVSSEDKKEIEKRALKKGYNSISSFLRDMALGNI